MAMTTAKPLEVQEDEGEAKTAAMFGQLGLDERSKYG
jgi:hypothetical protein